MNKIEFIERYGEEAYQRKLEYFRQYQKKYNQQHREKTKEKYKKYNRKHRQMFAYCIPEQIEQIENYQFAKKDNFDGWCIHHRFECIETGGKVIRTATAKELQELGLYYNRPASELIFLTISEHMKLHSINKAV